MFLVFSVCAYRKRCRALRPVSKVWRSHRVHQYTTTCLTNLFSRTCLNHCYSHPSVAVVMTCGLASIPTHHQTVKYQTHRLWLAGPHVQYGIGHTMCGCLDLMDSMVSDTPCVVVWTSWTVQYRTHQVWQAGIWDTLGVAGWTSRAVQYRTYQV